MPYDVLRQLATGCSNKEIARQLEVSPDKVKTHVARLLEKLGAGRRTAAIRSAGELGLIPQAARGTRAIRGRIIHPGDGRRRLIALECAHRLNTEEPTMLRTILAFGVAAGLVVAVPMCVMVTNSESGSAGHSYLVGYLVMLVGLSLVFVGVKRYRDSVLGGVIRFIPALGLGLAISAVAGVIYVIGWEITLALTHYEFMDSYAAAAIEAKRASGASAAEISAVTAQMAEFKAQYSNPWFRMPVTFVEIFPVGVLVSLISAALLRNSRFLPARPPAG